MNEIDNTEPVWVGMDVDAELARYAEENRLRAEAEATTTPAPRRSSPRRSLRAAIPTLGKRRAPRFPLAA